MGKWRRRLWKHVKVWLVIAAMVTFLGTLAGAVFLLGPELVFGGMGFAFIYFVLYTIVNDYR